VSCWLIHLHKFLVCTLHIFANIQLIKSAHVICQTFEEGVWNITIICCSEPVLYTLNSFRLKTVFSDTIVYMYKLVSFVIIVWLTDSFCGFLIDNFNSFVDLSLMRTY